MPVDTRPGIDAWRETLVRARVTAAPRLVFSVVVALLYATSGAIPFMVAQCFHFALTVGYFFIFLIPALSRSPFGRIATGAAAGYFRTLMDTLQVALAIHATGGFDSPFLIGLAMPVVFSSFGADPWRGRTAAILGSLCVFLSEVLTTMGWLPDVNLWGRGPTPSAPWQMILMGPSVTLCLWAVGTVANRLYVSAEQGRENAERERRNAQKLNEFSKALNASADFDNVIETIVSYMRTEYQLDSAILLLPDSMTGDLVAARVFSAADVDPDNVRYGASLRIPRTEGGIIRRGYERKKPLYIRATGKHDIFRRPYPGIDKDKEMFSRLKFHWFLQLPLVVQGETVGALLVTSYSRPEGLDHDEIVAVERFGEQIAGAVHAANLLNQITKERDRVEKARTAADALRLLAEHASTKLTLNEMIEMVLDFVEKQFSLSYFGFYFIDQTGQNLVHYRTRQGADVPDGVVDFLKGRTVPLQKEASAVAIAVLRGRTLYLPRMPRVARALDKDLAASAGLGSVIVVPLWVEGKPMGAFVASQYRKELRLSRDQIHQMEAFCTQISGMLRTARLLEETAAARKEADRSRAETERLAETAKKINETTDLK